MYLESVQLGWKALGKLLNKIISAVNANCPIEGSGIKISDTPAGKLIEITSAGGDAQDQPKWITGYVFDASYNMVKVKVYVKGDPKQLDPNPWMIVKLVDPADCSETDEVILTQPPATTKTLPATPMP